MMANIGFDTPATCRSIRNTSVTGSLLKIYHNRIVALQRSSSRNSANIRNPLIYYVNRYFLMFGGSQVQKPYDTRIASHFMLPQS